MKKRTLSLILVGCMAAALLAGCGSSSSDSVTDEAAGDAETSVVEEAAGTDAEEESDAEDISADVTYEDLELTLSISFPEATVYGQYATTFIDYVTEHSGGAINITPYYGGTFCDASEEVDYVVDGAIDISFVLPVYAMETMPIWNLAGNSADGNQGCVDLAKYIYFENEETAAIAEAEAAAAGIKVLGVMSGPMDSLCSSIEITNWDDVAQTTYGTEVMSQAFVNLGVNVQTIAVSDMYESLSRGLINAAGGGLAGMVMNGYYEVCDNVLVMSVANAMPPVFMNLDKWDSLPVETQQLLLDAAEYAADASVAMQEDADASALETMEEAGCTINYMSEEDNARYLDECYKGNYASYYPFAEALGEADGFDAVAEATLEYIGSSLTLQDLKDAM